VVKKKSRATNFSENLSADLEKKTKKIGFTWAKNWPIPKAKNETVDVVGLRDHKPVVLVEVELRRGNPVSNVAKIWRWIDKQKPTGPILFFQVLSKFYKVHPNQEQNALFIGNKLGKSGKGIRYLQLPLNYSPRKHAKAGGGRRRKAARKLARRILKDLRKLL
jgi:hypothetical protein